MFDFLFTVVQTIASSVYTIFRIIVDVPTYIVNLVGYLNMFPTNISIFLGLILTVSVVISVKRLLF